MRIRIGVVGDVPLHKVGIREVENFLSVKKSEASDWTARKYYIALASAFEAAKRWIMIANNPFRQVEKPSVREIQPAYFSKSEFQTLLKSMEDRDFRELGICVVSTGLRLAELTTLQWTDVDVVQKSDTCPKFRDSNHKKQEKSCHSDEPATLANACRQNGEFHL